MQACSSGKTRHKTRQQAIDHMAHLRRDRTRDHRPGKNPSDLNAYRCPECKDWHVGHAPKPKRRRK